ncbi:hypothetical protein BN874_2470004 [Candidatus Contendobacter odensis Run_B_J11]|uniref:Excalibur calcium-binding domain-containing protein n=1 Tax=Candidatus Contendobacter odensis Run_B_J11 TaxID=1400861 RepID=A0A7U7GBR5_9GAMM|nr:hypothetical protein BN874_2470004 [Candidatus Contendobacter odensis Run_B_J11]
MEDFAKNTNAGLWALPADQRIPLWEWRHPPAAAAVPVVPAAPVIMSAPSVAPRPIPSKPTATASAGWTCEAKITCKQMSSCDEAKFYLTTCGVKRLDGNGDGVPCEKLCR